MPSAAATLSAETAPDARTSERERGWSAQRVGWIVAAIVAVGSAIRLYRFWIPPLWRDEDGTWGTAVHADWHEGVHRGVPIQGQSPLYYVVVKLSCQLFGTSPFSLRLPSECFGIATLLLAYPLGLKVFRQQHAALATAVLFALSEPLIWYSQEARPYSFAFFCIILSFISYLAVLEVGTWPARVSYVLSTALLFYAHYLFTFVVVIQVLYLFLVR